MIKDNLSGGKAKWITFYANEIALFFASEKTVWNTDKNSPEQFKPIKNTDGVALFCRKFYTDSVSAATIDVTALGVFDLWINGKRIGEKSDGKIVYDELKPGWTDYSKRVFYFSYDISDYLMKGENTVVAAVAPGWWNGKISYGTYGRNHVSFMAAIHYIDSNGINNIYTDDLWLGSWGGAIRAADIYDGELYDANYPNYSEISSDSNLIEWNKVLIENHDIEIVPYIGPKVRIREELDKVPENVTVYQGVLPNESDYGIINVVSEYDNSYLFSIKKGQIAVIDIGQNLSGWPELSLSGAKDTVVQVRMGEMLNNSGKKEHGNDGPEGSLYTSNLRDAKAKIYCVLSESEHIEKYMPTFTYFGFRYLEITATEDIDIDDIVVHVVGSDINEIGYIETSNSNVNKLISNILWGQRSNYFYVPTDCPQRNERLGWAGDTQAFCGTAAYNSDCKEFFEKWLQDMRDSQSITGAYSDIAPRSDLFGDGSAGWADAGIIVPYTMWRMYGDTKIINDHYSSMERYMEWISHNGFKGPNDTYADWLAVDWTEREYMAAIWYLLDAKYMIALSKAINKEEKARYYSELYKTLLNNFRNTFLDYYGNILNKYSTQTAYLLALKAGVFENRYKINAIKALKEKIIENDYKLSTGFIGTSIINLVLAENGENNLAYSLLLQEELPSWLYAVKMGATTVWERWDSFTDENGFKVEGNDSSFNHYSYGAVEEWIYRYVAGIETTEEYPGFVHPVLQPHPDTRTVDEIPRGQERIKWIKCEFESPQGIIKSQWSLSETEYVYEFETPVSSTLKLPIVNDFYMINFDGVLTDIDHYSEYIKDSVIIIEVEPGKHIITQSR